MTTLAACPVVQSAESFRAAFGALAADTLLTDAARTARLLAEAVASSMSLDELYAVSRFYRRANPDTHLAPFSSYLEGLHFYRRHRQDDPSNIDFDALREAAWMYLDYLDADI